MPDSRVADILKKVQRIQIVANRTVNDLFAGQYKSVFRGRGMEFDRVRQYEPGDDIRTIDWNVTARTGDCFVKLFAEERELTVLFLVDVSASGMFGSTHQSKLDLVVEVAALLMFSALKNNDKVGLIKFLRRRVGLPAAAQGQGARAAHDPATGGRAAGRPRDESDGGPGFPESRAEAAGRGVPDQRLPRPQPPAAPWRSPTGGTT